MKSIVVVLALCGAVTFTVTAQQKPASQPQTADAALGAAIHLEEVGDLDSAIAAYRAFLSKYASNRPLAAKAQFYLGRTYETRGDAQARQAYERVVREFGDQKNVATDAGKRLALLSVPRSGVDLVTRRVFADETSDTAVDVAVSDDGRWMAVGEFAQARPETGDIKLRNLATGQVRHLATGGCNGCVAVGPVFSHDGRQIAYEWRDSEDLPGEMRVIGTDAGAKPRVVSRDKDIGVFPVAWSPDDRSILTIVARPKAPFQIAWTAVSDGTRTVIKTMDYAALEAPPRPKLSPDGKFIALAAVPRGAPRAAFPQVPEYQIHVLAADGSSEEPLTRDSSNQRPVWTPDGSHIVFLSTRDGSDSLWAVPMRDGRGAGNPLLIKRNIGRMWSTNMTRSGSLYYTADQTAGNESFSIFEAELDPTTGKQRSAARYLSERFVGLNCCAAYSPDGKSVAFKRFRSDNSSIRDLVVRTLATGAERTYTSPDWTNRPFGFGPGAPKWLSDGSLFVGDEPILGQTRSIGRMSSDGQFTRLVQIPPRLGWVAALSSDEKTAYVLSRRTDEPYGPYAGVVAVDLATGQQTSVFSAKDGLVMSVHPSADGRRLALLVQAEPGGRTSSALATMRTDGSDYRELYATTNPIGRVPDQVQWSKDGTAIFFVDGGRLLRIAAEGGTPADTGVRIEGQGPGHSFRVSPDGSRVAFSGGKPRLQRNEVWAIDNLMAVLKPTR